MNLPVEWGGTWCAQSMVMGDMAEQGPVQEGTFVPTT